MTIKYQLTPIRFGKSCSKDMVCLLYLLLNKSSPSIQERLSWSSYARCFGSWYSRYENRLKTMYPNIFSLEGDIPEQPWKSCSVPAHDISQFPTTSIFTSWEFANQLELSCLEESSTTWLSNPYVCQDENPCTKFCTTKHCLNELNSPSIW